MPKFRHVLLTGLPGVGKTTLTRKTCDALSARGVAVNGFYTEEVRVQGRRIGFDVVSVPGGERRPLARIPDEGERTRGPMVGQYTVDVASFESIALPVLTSHKGNSSVLVVDEVGKMELFSSRFTPALESALQTCTLLATIPVQRARPIPAVERLRSRSDVLLVTVQRENRDDPALLENIIAVLTSNILSKQL
ncbi:hypothetical protein B566_EDAN017584 [Ephemera danica]|nr:hypothetical protein B566_EDAN017584 [Ephemera danica]